MAHHRSRRGRAGAGLADRSLFRRTESPVTNTGLHPNLLEIRRELMSMAAVVDDRATTVLSAIEASDFASAEVVRHGDREVDELELEIEQMCIEVLARYAPVAGDLRTVLATLRVNGELERLGDLAKSTAKRLLHLNELGFLTAPEILQRMARTVIELLKSTLDALGREDATLARQVRANDAQVDEFQRIVLDWTQNELIRGDSRQNEAAVDLLTIARNLERMGDMCTNIAEDVIYLVEGRVVRHSRA
jgi:phosphate transport system protein